MYILNYLLIIIFSLVSLYLFFPLNFSEFILENIIGKNIHLYGMATAVCQQRRVYAQPVEPVALADIPLRSGDPPLQALSSERHFLHVLDSNLSA